MREPIAALAITALLAGAGSALADPNLVDISQPGTTLQDVIDGGGHFQVADKRFMITDFFSVAFNASEIGISPLDFGMDGIGFRLSDAWADFPGDPTPSDFTLSYMVEIVNRPADWLIIDNRLIFDGFATGPGSFARVDETVLDDTGALVGEKSVFANGDGTRQLEDLLDFPDGYRKLNIVKNAQFFAPLPDGTAGASVIDQTFSQIPAPGAALFGVAAGLVAVRRRR